MNLARVIKQIKYPTQEQYKAQLKITAIGTAAIGTIGFVIFLLSQLL